MRLLRRRLCRLPSVLVNAWGTVILFSYARQVALIWGEGGFANFSFAKLMPG